MDDTDDFIIVEDKKIYLEVVRQGITHNNYMFLFGTCLLVGWSILGMIALGYSVFTSQQPETWAIGVESSSVTAALAVIFKDHLPTLKRNSNNADP